MTTWTDYLVARERRRDEMARAARYRLTKLAPRRETWLGTVGRRLLARLGRILVAWGRRLQAQSTRTPSSSTA